CLVGHSQPFTDEELTRCIELAGRKVTAQSVRSRRAEAIRNGWIKVADRDGVTRAGRACRRYLITIGGLAALETAKTEQEWKAERRAS
ncbi:MAG: hypothetical protein ACLR7M_01510, partial [Varibaculum timonense]